MLLVTNRLCLRPFRPSDFEAVHAYASDPVVTQHTDWGPNSEADTRRFLDDCLAEERVSPRQCWTFAITEGNDRAPVGTASLWRMQPGEGALGYVLRRDRWGRGYATEVTKALVAFAFDTLGLHTLSATCRPANCASRRVLEKVGFRLVGEVEGPVLVDGRRLESLRYRLMPIGRPQGQADPGGG